jgi:hypothetical protein
MMSEKNLPYTLEETLMCVKEALKDYKGKFKEFKKYLRKKKINQTLEDYILDCVERAYLIEKKCVNPKRILSIKEFWEFIYSWIYCMHKCVDDGDFDIDDLLVIEEDEDFTDKVSQELFKFFNYVAEKCEKIS